MILRIEGVVGAVVSKLSSTVVGLLAPDSIMTVSWLVPKKFSTARSIWPRFSVAAGTKDSATAVNVGVVGSWLMMYALAGSLLNVIGDPPVVNMTLAPAGHPRVSPNSDMTIMAPECIEDSHQCSLRATVPPPDNTPRHSRKKPDTSL